MTMRTKSKHNCDRFKTKTNVCYFFHRADSKFITLKKGSNTTSKIKVKNFGQQEKCINSVMV